MKIELQKLMIAGAMAFAFGGAGVLTSTAAEARVGHVAGHGTHFGGMHHFAGHHYAGHHFAVGHVRPSGHFGYYAGGYHGYPYYGGYGYGYGYPAYYGYGYGGCDPYYGCGYYNPGAAIAGDVIGGLFGFF